jgi:8-oxo-dGTP diphosphatase
MPAIGRHYVTPFVACTRTGGEARVREPEKATAPAWLTPEELRARRGERFTPLVRCLDAGFLQNALT